MQTAKELLGKMQKKVLLICGIILCLIFIVATAIFLLKIKNNTSSLVTEASLDSLKIKECKLYPDIKTIFDSRDISKCDCLSNENTKNQCLANITDSNIYTKALKDLDIKICQQLSLASMQNSCVTVVKNEINYKNKQK